MSIRLATTLVSSVATFAASITFAATPPGCTGDILATYRNVSAYSNAPDQGGFDTCGPYGTDGWQYTCVEYIRRFYREAFGIDTSLANGWSGDAKDFYPPGDTRDMIGFENGKTTVPPQPDDTLVFDRGAHDSKGHVSIVSSVIGNQVSLIEENYPLKFPAQVALSQDPVTHYWSISPRQGLPVKGWLRLKSRFVPSPTFAAKVDKATGTEPLSLVVADLDGDGLNDIAVTIYNHGNGDHLTIFRNSGSTPGNLRFDVPVDVPVGGGPEGLAVGDLNNDGKPDLVTANAGSSSITVLRNFSRPGFLDFEPVPLSLSAPPTPHRVVIADFDGDGLPDIIVTSNSGRLVSVFHHAPDPNTIAFDYRMDFGASDYLNDLAVADIDGDQKPDLIVPLTDNGQFTLYQNTSTQGNVNATALPPFATGGVPTRGVAVGDLNNGHHVDIVVAAPGGVGIFENHSAPGVFVLPRTDVLTGTNPDQVAIGDLDKDGFLDVVVANPSDNTLTVLHNTTASVGAPIQLTPLTTTIQTGSTPLGLAIGDLDGDGWPDIVVANDEGASISIILNTTGRK